MYPFVLTRLLIDVESMTARGWKISVYRAGETGGVSLDAISIFTRMTQQLIAGARGG